MKEPHQEQAQILAAQADPRRFAPLYDLYFPHIFRFILRRIRRHDLTSDLTQETFLKAMLALPRYQDRGLPFRAWLYRIALNEMRMHWRKKKEVLIEMSYLEVRGLSEEMGLSMQEEEMRLLGQALGRLHPDRARLIQLRYMDGMTFLELGQILGIAEEAAKMRTHRVLATLRTYLAPRA